MEGNQVCKWNVDGQYVCYQLGNSIIEHAPIPGNVPYMYQNQLQAPVIYDTTNLYEKPPHFKLNPVTPVDSFIKPNDKFPKPTTEKFTQYQTDNITAKHQTVGKLAKWDCGWRPLNTRKGWFYV